EPLSRVSGRQQIASRAVTPATAAVAIASLFRFDLLDLKAAPSSARSIASPPTRDHIQFALGCRPVRMPMPLVISRAPSILNKPLGLPRRPISFAKLLGATISATPRLMLNQPRPRATFSSFGLFIPFIR